MIAKTRDIRLLLDNIRSVHNTASIFRTAETIGVTHIYCLGTTPVPMDRFGRKRKDFAKVSLGAENIIAWEHLDEADLLLNKLKKKTFQIIVIEQSSKAVNYKKLKPQLKSLLILGNEVDGVSKKLLQSADLIAEIPHKGKKESLNVAVAAGIAIYSLFDN